MGIPVFGATWTSLFTQGCALSTCCPYSKFYTTANAWYSSYYSPAVCPENYHTCNGPTEVSSALATGETAKFCCPSNYLCPLWSGFSICESALSTSTTATAMDLYDQTPLSIITVPPDPTAPYQYAYPLQIRWKEGDFSAVSTPTSTIPNTPTQTPATPSATVVLKNGLSTGAIVGIAVVAGIVVLAAIGVLVWWLRGKRTVGRSRAADATRDEQDRQNWEKAELDAGGREKKVSSTVAQDEPLELEGGGGCGGKGGKFSHEASRVPDGLPELS